MKNIKKRILSIVLCLAMLATVLPLSVFAQEIEKAPLPITVISDLHYYPDSLTGDDCDAFVDFCQAGGKQFLESVELLNHALNTILKRAQKNNTKYVLIPGDVTKDSEYAGHTALAQTLEAFEQESGIDVIVVNGNHDINNPRAVTFENGTKEAAKLTTPEEYYEIYKNLGFDLACSRYYPETGKHGMLSYAVQLDGGYRLIVIDSCKYTSDITDSGLDVQETGACLTPGLKDWIAQQAREADEAGEDILVMTHPSTIPHMDVQATFFKDFVLDDWEECADFLADLGVKFTFTGHMHVTDIANYVSDNGNTIYDIATSSLIGYPNMFHEVVLDNTGENLTAKVDTVDIDCEENVVINGVTYEKPFKESFSLKKTFGAGLEDYLMSLVWSTVTNYCDLIIEAGGIVNFLKEELNLDIETLLSGFLGDGVSLGKLDIFTVKNLMSFIADFDKQLVDNYVSNPEKLEEIVRTIIRRALSVETSELPATTFYDSYGIGTPGQPATLEETAYTVLVYLYNDNMNASNDPFMLDVIDGFKNGDTFFKFYDVVYDALLNYLIQDQLLSTLELHIDTLFPKGMFGHYIAEVLDGVISLIFKFNKSFENIANTVLGWGFFENFNSLTTLANYFINEYLTDSQLASLGHYVGTIIEDFVVPNEVADSDVTIVIDDPVVPEATADNFRRPSMITLSLGEDASTSVALNWYTKYSVTGSDIEIVPYNEEYVFSGTPTTGDNISATSTEVTLNYPAVDIGIIGFMESEAHLVRHSIVLSELEPGTKYMYRVGDAERGWWSDTGVFKTADNSDSVTFLHITDPQAQNTVQYEAFREVIESAESVYSDIDFIQSTGDQVDAGENMNQWKYLLNTAPNAFMNYAFMPTTGNHEDEGAALDSYFLLPNVPEQDTETGVYYSYDYNNVHMAVLNTNDLGEDEALSDAQIEWLKKDMAASDAEWKMVSFHKAIYSNGSHYDDDDVCAIRAQLSTLMPELDIDLVLQGHDHVYLRTDVMADNKIVETGETTVSFGGKDYKAKIQPDGTMYVISGCAGVKYYLLKSIEATDKLFPRAEAIVEVSGSMFSGIQIDGETLYFDAYKVVDGKAERIDSFAITHSETEADEEPSSEEPSILEKIINIIKTLFDKIAETVKGLFTPKAD